MFEIVSNFVAFLENLGFNCVYFRTANIHSENLDTRKKSVKVTMTIKHCKSVFTFLHCPWSSN